MSGWMAATAVFRMLMALPPKYGESEPLPERWERMHAAAQAIASAADKTPDPHLTARLLSAVAWHETRLSQWVGVGGCAKVGRDSSQCDGGRARSYWQLWQVSCPELWALEPGSREALEQAAHCASRHLWSGYRSCLAKFHGNSRLAWIGALSRYATGHRCYWSGASERYRTAVMLTGGR